eukprot:scaffold9324_cov144-Amphora_coffeaeformis.AAC.4
MPRSRYVKMLKALFHGAKRLKFVYHCDYIAVAHASPNEISDFHFENDCIQNDPDHVVMECPNVGMPQVDALYVTLAKTSFCQITSLALLMGAGDNIKSKK